MTTSRVGLVVNPTAGKNRGSRLGIEVAARLRGAGHQVLDLSDETLPAARDRILGALSQGIEVLVVVGGDGMAHLGVNMLAGTDVPLAIVAAGTGNDMARSLGLPLHDPIAAADLVTRGTTKRIDAVRHVDAHGNTRWYAGILGAGFDSLVNERANQWNWPRGRMRYNLAIARELPLFKAIPYAITVDDEQVRTRAMLVTVGNSVSYGGGMKVAPDALMDDGLLDVMVVHEVSIPEFLKVFPKVFNGTHTTHPAVQMLRGRSVTLEAADIIAYADGERFGPLPLTVEVVPGALTVMVPSLA